MFSLMPWTRSRRTPVPRTEMPFGWIPEEFEHLFNRLVSREPVLETAEWPYGWGLTMEEKEKEILVRVELPGFKPEEVKVEVTPERLMVEAEHKVSPEKKEEKEKKPETPEWGHTHVKRTMTLPPEIEVEKVEAVYRNGLLEVHLPRKTEMMARRIEVKST